MAWMGMMVGLGVLVVVLLVGVLCCNILMIGLLVGILLRGGDKQAETRKGV